MIDATHPELSVRRQCEILGVHRSGLYYKPVEESALNLELMRQIDKQYTQTPFFGSPKMTEWLRRRLGYKVNHKRIERLMRLMGLQAMVPGPNTDHFAKLTCGFVNKRNAERSTPQRDIRVTSALYFSWMRRRVCFLMSLRSCHWNCA